MAQNTSYLVIARKYRPGCFDDVVGQNHVSTTLKNAIRLNRVGHAYLFCGPRGVGKTSMARIFARALNCKNGPTSTPCNTCSSCVEIDQSRSLDVMEIDGASNRGIDDIRTLRENVKFSPSNAKYKIYIIDEVHQITGEGFNALLKTLEEPPAHVKFIFATTDWHKVPATILSRCQRFDFRRIALEAMVECLRAVVKKEKIKIDEDALWLIARSADGSLRDSQSILDQIASCAEGTVTKKDAVHALGLLEDEKMFEIFDALSKKEPAIAMTALNDLLTEGKNPALLCEKLLEHTRNLLLLSASLALKDLVDTDEATLTAMIQQAGRFKKDELFYFFSVLSQSMLLMRRFELKRVPLEVALLKLAQRAPMEELSVALEKLKNISMNPKGQSSLPSRGSGPMGPNHAGPGLGINGPALGSAEKTTLIKTVFEEEHDPPEIEELPDGDILPVSEVYEKKQETLSVVWGALLKTLKAEKISVGTYLEEGEPLGVNRGVARIGFPSDQSFHREFLETTENKKLIEKHLTTLLGESVRVEFENTKAVNSASEPNQSSNAKKESAPLSPEADRTMKSAMNIFGGRVTHGS